jgi:CDP-diacylglycerol pyrophosphatase
LYIADATTLHAETFIVKRKALTIAVVAGGLVAASLPGLSTEIFGEQHTLTRNDLWRVIHRVCIPASSLGLPFPCSKVVTEGGGDAGYAILPVASGHILTVPTQRVVGIEAKELLSPGQPNYWQAAWETRARLDADFSRAFDRADIAMALNSAYGRTQDQLHIHTSCVRRRVKTALEAEPTTFGPRWTRMKTPLDGITYSVRWVAGADLNGVNVFELLPPEARRSSASMARQTLIVVGGRDHNHAPGFFILNDQADGDNNAHGEDLLDLKCRV